MFKDLLVRAKIPSHIQQQHFGVINGKGQVTISQNIAQSLSGLGHLWRRDTSNASGILLSRLNYRLFTYVFRRSLKINGSTQQYVSGDLQQGFSPVFESF